MKISTNPIKISKTLIVNRNLIELLDNDLESYLSQRNAISNVMGMLLKCRKIDGPP